MKKDIKFVALVPMKSHSERLSNKNIKMINGKPLFYWIINSLYKSKFIKDVYVDTDSIKIAKLAKKYFSKIKIILRPEKLIGDLVSMNKIIEYDLSHIKDCDYFLQTHSTNPLLTTNTIDDAISSFLNSSKNDSLFSVNRFQSRFYDYKFRPINHNSKKLIRTQDLHPLYEENSNLFLFTRDSFAKMARRIGARPLLYVMPKIESIDIDDFDDFIMAEAILSYINNGH